LFVVLVPIDLPVFENTLVLVLVSLVFVSDSRRLGKTRVKTNPTLYFKASKVQTLCSIKAGGLDPNYGGIGGATQLERTDLIESDKGKTYLSSSLGGAEGYAAKFGVDGVMFKVVVAQTFADEKIVKADPHYYATALITTDKIWYCQEGAWVPLADLVCKEKTIYGITRTIPQGVTEYEDNECKGEDDF